VDSRTARGGGGSHGGVAGGLEVFGRGKAGWPKEIMMRRLRALWVRFCALFGGGRVDEEFDAELEGHIAEHTRDGVLAGLSVAEARREAVLRLGGAEQARQAYRDRATLPELENVARDVRYALRVFRRNPVFAITAILTLALGIGATSAVFSVVDRILFRSLPYAHPEQLVSVGMTAPIIPQEFMLGDSYFNWEDHQGAFSQFTSESGVNECDLTERNPQRLSCASVEQNFLPTLGVSPILGRNFLPEEDRPQGPKAALITYGLWVSRFGRDAGVVNRTVQIDMHPVRVIGVLPKDFEMPALEKADILMPEALGRVPDKAGQPTHVLYAFGRLKPGLTFSQAMDQLKPVFDYALSLAPARFRSEVHLRVRPIRDRQVQDVRLVAWILLGAVIAVLLIACANVASLLLARAAARERELAVRSALGATRAGLVRQMLTESILLSLIGTSAGCILAEGLLRLFVAIAPSSMPFLAKAQVDLRIVGFTVVLGIGAGVVFGLAPALFRPRPIAIAARTPAGQTRALLRRAMVVMQIAASMILLAGAMLLVRSFANLQNQKLGMDSHGVLTAAISLNRERYATPQLQMRFFNRVEEAMRRLPGVSEVAIADSMPPGGYQHDQIFSIIEVAGRPVSKGGTGGMVKWRLITPDYFKALDIPILKGVRFTDEERKSNGYYLVLSESLAARLFPGEVAVGKKLKPTPNEPWHTVVGIARDVKNGGLETTGEPEFYRLRRNELEDWSRAPEAVLILKTSTPPKALAPWVRSQIAQIDGTVPVEIETLNERVAGLADRPRFEMALLSFFACTGLAMALIGLYGVVAFMAQQRTREIGIRIAVGADRGDVLRLILREGLRLIVVGGVIGLCVSLVLSRVLESVLFGVGPRDPVTFVGVPVVLALVALVAVLIPARAAMKTDPVTALRWE
jgi:putative ABC transport system permease protein